MTLLKKLLLKIIRLCGMEVKEEKIDHEWENEKVKRANMINL